MWCLTALPVPPAALTPALAGLRDLDPPLLVSGLVMRPGTTVWDTRRTRMHDGSEYAELLYSVALCY